MKLTGKDYGRVAITSLIGARPGRRTRLIYRTTVRRGRPGEAKGFTSRSSARLRDTAHQQLGGSIVGVDNDRQHLSRLVRDAIEARSTWLTVFQLPAYAPELNPADGIWASLSRGLGKLAPRGIDELTAVVMTKLKRMQYRHDGLLDGFIAETGFTLEPPPFKVSSMPSCTCGVNHLVPPNPRRFKCERLDPLEVYRNQQFTTTTLPWRV